MKSILIPLIVAGHLMAAIQEGDLKDEAGQPIAHYFVEAPTGLAPAGAADPTKQVGVILCFQEHTEAPSANIYPVRESLKRLGLSEQYVLLAIKAQGAGGGLGAGDNEPIKQLIAWAKKTYPINPRRIYMFGKGSGGHVAGEFTTLNPDLITAGIAYSWGWWNMVSELDQPLDMVNTAPELYLVLGMRDFTHHITTVRDTFERVRAKGYHVIYREFDELGDRAYHPASNDDAISWATRLRNKTIPPSREEMALLQAPTMVAGYYQTLALVGGAPAGAVLEKLFASSDAAVRAAAAETCNFGIYSEATTAALGKLLADPSAKVRNAALRAIASYANWRSPAAQRALIERATDRSLDLDARLDAADGLVRAVQLQASGVPQDPPMFKALVSLLSEREKNEPLHAAAYIALAPIRPYIIGGSNGGQFAPEGGWDRWLDRITTEQLGDGVYYRACANNNSEALDLFCKGGALVSKNPARAFQLTLKAAQAGHIPAQEVTGMMYAIGKGIQQNYREAAKWFLTAAEAGNPRAAANYVGALRSGTPGLRTDPELAARWAKFLEVHPEYSPVPGR